MASRDPSLLDPELRRRWHCLERDWRRAHPDGPRVMVTCTHEHAPAGQQPYHLVPSLGLRVAFLDPAGMVVVDSEAQLAELRSIAARFGIESDGDTFQVPGYDWRGSGAKSWRAKWPEMPAEEAS